MTTRPNEIHNTPRTSVSVLELFDAWWDELKDGSVPSSPDVAASWHTSAEPMTGMMAVNDACVSTEVVVAVAIVVV